jgi:hypothetical protein
VFYKDEYVVGGGEIEKVLWFFLSFN